MTKLCRDCRWYDHVDLIASRCTNPVALAAQLQSGARDPVDGRSDAAQLGRCWAMRAAVCGAAARFFEPRRMPLEIHTADGVGLGNDEGRERSNARPAF